MGRRKELRSVCHDLLDSFVSRYNDLDGYWALGKFQAYLQSASEDRLRFDLADDGGGEDAFPTTLSYYRRTLRRHLATREIPTAWVQNAVLVVEQNSPSELACVLKITDDRGKVFQSRKMVAARPHDPHRELRRCGQHGPQNQKGE